jgi:hypothetical protein
VEDAVDPAHGAPDRGAVEDVGVAAVELDAVQVLEP